MLEPFCWGGRWACDGWQSVGPENWHFRNPLSNWFGHPSLAPKKSFVRRSSCSQLLHRIASVAVAIPMPGASHASVQVPVPSDRAAAVPPLHDAKSATYSSHLPYYLVGVLLVPPTGTGPASQGMASGHFGLRHLSESSLYWSMRARKPPPPRKNSGRFVKSTMRACRSG